MISTDRVILHSDINNFFASVECANNPALKNFPVAVSGNPRKRNGIILAKNNLAKSFSVLTGEPIWQAKQKCPSLICVPPHMDQYQKISKEIIEKVYFKFTDKVEPFSIDECFLDVTASQKLFGSGEEIAEKIRKQLREEFSITVSVGISFCKVFAKLGSDLKKPDAQTLISRGNFRSIVWPLPVGEIIGVGKRTEKQLLMMDILTLGDLAKADESVLGTKFGKPLIELKNNLLGFDDRPVLNYYDYTPPKSVGNGTTTIRDIETADEIKETMDYLSESVAFRLREKKLVGTTISVTIKKTDLSTCGREKTIPYYIDDATDISKEAFSLLKTFWTFSEPVRAIRISVSNLETTTVGRQMSLFDLQEQKKSDLNKGLDFIQNKYGKNTISLASSKTSKFINGRLKDADD